MVQVINLGPTKSALQADVLQNTLGRALNEGLGKFTTNMFINKKITEMENDKELMAKPLSDRLLAAQKALAPFGEDGKQYFQQRMQLEQQREQERESGILRKALEGKPISERESLNLRPENQFKLAQIKKELQVASRIKNDLTDLGIDENIAENYANLYRDATEGAKTQILNHILELKKRNIIGSESEDFTNQSIEELGNPKKNNEEFQWPNLQSEKGFTPSEIAKTRREREKTNVPFYNEITKKVRAAKEEGILLNRLEQLNPQMPQGVLGKVNIDLQNGNLRLPAGASPEAQLYVKTVNEFTKNAKDTYGSRLTNFDLSQFLKRLPTLSNSMEGRDLIISQMKIINELNKLENQSLKDVYNKYGVGNINNQQATAIADQYKASKEEELLRRFEDLDGKLKQVDGTTTGTIKMIAPNGRMMNVPQDKVEELEKLGAKRG